MSSKLAVLCFIVFFALRASAAVTFYCAYLLSCLEFNCC
jgi:hypothetical protein